MLKFIVVVAGFSFLSYLASKMRGTEAPVPTEDNDQGDGITDDIDDM
ncbi:hypothetical protein [Halalkalibacter urbisdiaboli]|nr:hypothetical protein [Halalkalibacter urbisdiaboli]